MVLTVWTFVTISITCCYLYLLQQRNHRNHKGRIFTEHYCCGSQNYLKKIKAMAPLTWKNTHSYITYIVYTVSGTHKLLKAARRPRLKILALGSKLTKEDKHFSNDSETDKEHLRIGHFNNTKIMWKSLLHMFSFSR